MDGKNPHAALIQALECFKSNDPRFYDSPLFRGALVRTIFEEQVRRKAGFVIKIPLGLRQEDPDIDELTDMTFDKVEEDLDEERIAEQPTPLARYRTCRALVLKVVTNIAIDFVKKNPFVWDHGDINDDLIGKSVTQDKYISLEAAVQADTELQKTEARIKQTLREFLRPVMGDSAFEIFWLREAKRLDYQELSVRFEKSAEAIRVQICRLRAKAKLILNDPLVRKRMLGEDNDQYY